MRLLSFLITLFFTLSTSAYDVVFKSGKRISGSWIGEDAVSIQLRDARDGTMLSIRKSTIDAETTDSVNRAESARTPQLPPSSKRRQLSLVEIANESKRARTGNAPLLTNADLPGGGGISVFGNTDPARTKTEASPSSLIPRSDERYWRKEASALRRELSLLREKHITAESKCAEARERAASRLAKPHRSAENLLILMETPSDCLKLVEAETQLKAAEMRLYDFEERARKSEVPWQWIE